MDAGQSRELKESQLLGQKEARQIAPTFVGRMILLSRVTIGGTIVVSISQGGRLLLEQGGRPSS